jgi:hypothetical protein
MDWMVLSETVMAMVTTSPALAAFGSALDELRQYVALGITVSAQSHKSAFSS